MTQPKLASGRRVRRAMVAPALWFGGLGMLGCTERTTAPVAEAADATAVVQPVIQWPMTRGGASLSGRVAAGVPREPMVAWTFSASAPVVAEATIFNDRVFVGTETGVLFCLDAESGRDLWRFDAGDSISSAAAAVGGVVYQTSNDGRLYAIDAAKGTELWRFEIEDKISTGAIVVESPIGDGHWILVNGYDGTTRVLNAVDGSVVWTYKTEDYINGAPAVVDGRFVVFGGCDAQLHVVNLADGSLVHTIPTDAYIPASIGTFGTMAFCGNYANQVVAFDVVAGTVAWTYEDRALPFMSSPGLNERLVFIGSRDKHLHAIDLKSGAGAWKFQTGGRVEGSPVVFDDGVVFGSSDGRLYAAVPDDGKEIWRLDLGEPLVASPAYGGRQIIVSGSSGTVFAIRGSKDHAAPASVARPVS